MFWSMWFAMLTFFHFWTASSDVNGTRYHTLLRSLPFSSYGEDPSLMTEDPCSMNTELTSPRKIAEARAWNLQCNIRPITCDEATESSSYRTIDGSCNNLQNPSWGMSKTCYRRILPQEYSDDKGTPKTSCTGNHLPNPRVVSNVVHQDSEENEILDKHSVHSMEFGQLVAHDVSAAEFYEAPDIGYGECCYPDYVEDEKCLSFPVPPNDPFYTGKRTCVPFTRSIPCPLCQGGRRESLNSATSYLDGSVFYGDTMRDAFDLRTFRDGMMKVQKVSGHGTLLPGVDKLGTCVSKSPDRQCFKAADPRCNIAMILTTLITVFVRNHNYLCEQLKSQHPTWGDERLYQEARRINVAQFQLITYRDYLPMVIGRENAARFHLLPRKGKARTRYNPSMDASITDEFAAACFRFGHTMIPNDYHVTNQSSLESRVIHLRDYYAKPEEFYDGLADELAVGMGRTCAKHRDAKLSTDVRNWLFGELNKYAKGGYDLAAASIARNTDHGIPGYTCFLKHIFNYDVKCFGDLLKFMTAESVRKLQECHDSVHDVNLYTGGLSERLVPGGLVGPTIAAVLIDQFEKLKFGDRFYFEHQNQLGDFTPEQLIAIKESTFATILCGTTPISETPRDAFLPPSKKNPIVQCSTLTKLDITKF